MYTDYTYMYIKNDYLFKNAFAQFTYDWNFVWWIVSLKNWLAISLIEVQWRVQLEDIHISISMYLYVLICKQSLAHLNLLYIYELKTSFSKQKKKEKCILLGSNQKILWMPDMIAFNSLWEGHIMPTMSLRAHPDFQILRRPCHICILKFRQDSIDHI